MSAKKMIRATKALFIKLGQNGEWERGCINLGTLRLDYREVPHDVCMSGNWQEARNAFPPTANQGAVTRHINQVQQFYEEPSDTLWITFFSDRLWWCFSNTTITQAIDGSKQRKAIGKWCDTDINGNILLKGRLSGKLLAIQGFQGTICCVKELDYLLHKINGTQEPHVAKAESAIEELTKAIVPIIRNLHPKDLETLTDLIFRQAGWQRTGVAGETEKDIDLDLLSPITQERIAIQVKSKATLAMFQSYQSKYSDMRGFTRFYFVTHSPNTSLARASAELGDSSFIFWGVEQLAQQVVRNGLVGWIIDKAS